MVAVQSMRQRARDVLRPATFGLGLPSSLLRRSVHLGLDLTVACASPKTESATTEMDHNKTLCAQKQNIVIVGMPYHM